MGSAGRLLGRRSSYCGAFEPAYQSDPDGLLRTLNCCHGLGQEHAEQFGRLCTAPDSYWYGIHTVETLFAVKVTPEKGKQFLERGVQAAVEYLRSRLDLVERLNTDPAN